MAGVEAGLQVGAAADLTIIDTKIEYRVAASEFQSLSQNCPFDGWHMKGRAILTMVAGRIVYGE